MTIQKCIATGLLAAAISTLSHAQVIRGTNGDAAVLPSTVSSTISALGPSWYAAALISDSDGLVGVTGCQEGHGVMYIAAGDGSVRELLRRWSLAGDQVADGIAALICRAAAARGLVPAAPAHRARPINPQNL